jgi:hypothetical protein
MTDIITFVTLAASSEPFQLDVGDHAIAVSGVFNNARVTLERRSPNHHPSEGDQVVRPLCPPISLWQTVAGPFGKAVSAEFKVAPISAGFYRVRIDASETPPSINAVISGPPAMAPATAAA